MRQHNLRSWGLRNGWAFVAVLLVTLVQVNNFLYFNRLESYDGRQHFANYYLILRQGRMPPPPITSLTYEVHQAPLYYFLTAFVALPTAAPVLNSFEAQTIRFKAALNLPGSRRLLLPSFEPGVYLFNLALAVGWTLAITLIVGRGLRRLWWPLKTFTVTVIGLMPVNLLMAVMYGNDMPVVLFGLMAAAELWFLTRTGHATAHRSSVWRWLRAGLFAGLSVAFKTNGLVLVVLYLALAGFSALVYLHTRRPGQVRRLARLSVIAVPIMLVPFAFNVYHSSRYVDNLLGATTQRISVFERFDLRFFSTFDTSIFASPFAWGSGEGSYWSLQYAQLHSDYYNHFNSPVYRKLPSEKQVMNIHRPPISRDHFEVGIRLQFWAIPITLLMLVGLLTALWRTVCRPRTALRDGSAVVILLFVLAQAAQFARFADYAELRAVTLHVRYMGFLWPFLLFAGLYFYWKWIGRRRTRAAYMLNVALLICLIGYSVAAAQFMWLPTVAF